MKDIGETYECSCPIDIDLFGAYAVKQTACALMQSAKNFDGLNVGNGEVLVSTEINTV